MTFRHFHLRNENCIHPLPHSLVLAIVSHFSFYHFSLLVIISLSHFVSLVVFEISVFALLIFFIFLRFLRFLYFIKHILVYCLFFSSYSDFFSIFLYLLTFICTTVIFLYSFALSFYFVFFVFLSSSSLSSESSIFSLFLPHHVNRLLLISLHPPLPPRNPPFLHIPLCPHSPLSPATFVHISQRHHAPPTNPSQCTQQGIFTSHALDTTYKTTTGVGHCLFPYRSRASLQDTLHTISSTRGSQKVTKGHVQDRGGSSSDDLIIKARRIHYGGSFVYFPDAQSPGVN